MKKRILIVDDNASLIIALQMMLEDGGFEVVTAGNGNEGYSAYLQASPDLVITDMHMPGKSGPELMKSIRQHDPEVEAIYMSGDWSPYQPFLDEEKKNRETIFLRKPFSLFELMRTVKVRLNGEKIEAALSPARSYTSGAPPLELR
jgi:DNA-binding NtrC family response regulator